jgi:hypothetical protein
LPCAFTSTAAGVKETPVLDMKRVCSVSCTIFTGRILLFDNYLAASFEMEAKIRLLLYKKTVILVGLQLKL